MATIKKPAKKMQNGGTAIGKGPDSYSKKLVPSTSKIRSEIMPKDKVDSSGKVKIKIKIKPDRKQAREDKNKMPLNRKMIEDVERDFMKTRSNSNDNPPPSKVMKKGGIAKAKNGKSFPDLNKDGKITKADILKGRGVIAKKGAKLKKAQSGASFKNITDMFGRTGGFDGGMRNQMAASILKKKKAAASPTMKSGGKMKKCAYGCK